MIKRFNMLFTKKFSNKLGYIKNQNHVVFKISALSPEVSIYHETS